MTDRERLDIIVATAKLAEETATRHYLDTTDPEPARLSDVIDYALSNEHRILVQVLPATMHLFDVESDLADSILQAYAGAYLDAWTSELHFHMNAQQTQLL